MRLGRGVSHTAGEREDRHHDYDLAREHPAPREVGREEPPDQRTGRHRYRAGGGNQAICAGAPLGWKVGCDEGDDGGQDQGGADALEK